MKTLIILIFNFLFFLNSFAQQKFERPPKPGKDKTDKFRNILPNKKGHLILNSGELKQNEDNLYCYQIDSKCNIIDGKITLYSYYITSGNDTPTPIQYKFAEGEFLEGKYQGIWKYYHKNGKIIKKEKWNNGKLIYRKEYKFDTCDNLEEYKFSNINLSGYNSVKQFKKDFLLKSGKLTCRNGVVKSMRLVFHDETTIQFIHINNGLVESHEIQIINDLIPSGKSYYYDKEGNIKRMSEVENEFIKGNSHYIDYYYPKNEKSSGVITTSILKSEGEVRNNFKIGEWKYYNKNGSIDSTKTYTLKDSVDVRFPYCIFNKKEPCYSEKG
jgi:antitoxin component YwqK of YwqJK toxin-antitoxin module